MPDLPCWTYSARPTVPDLPCGIDILWLNGIEGMHLSETLPDWVCALLLFHGLLYLKTFSDRFCPTDFARLTLPDGLCPTDFARLTLLDRLCSTDFARPSVRDGLVLNGALNLIIPRPQHSPVYNLRPSPGPESSPEPNLIPRPGPESSPGPSPSSNIVISPECRLHSDWRFILSDWLWTTDKERLTLSDWLCLTDFAQMSLPDQA